MTSDNMTKIQKFLEELDNNNVHENLMEISEIVIPFLGLPFSYKGFPSKVINYSCMDNQIVIVPAEDNTYHSTTISFKEFFKQVDFK